MRSRGSSRARLLLGILVLLAAASPASAPAAKGRAALSVMQYNIYQGNEFEDAYGAKSLQDLPNALAKVYRKVKATNFPARAVALAAQIKATQPALIGLSEASLYRTQFPSNPKRPASHVLYDYVALLVRALRAKGLRYHAVAITNNTEVQLTANLSRGATDFRFTDRVAILARAGVSVSNVKTANFLAKGHVTVGGVPLALPDGYASVDARVGGHALRFVETHLSGFTDTNVRNAESAELVQGPLRTALPVVLVCDCNSKPGTTAYSTLARAPLKDTWAQAHPGRPGVTCCHARDLRGNGFVERTRLDYVWQRGLRTVTAAVVGGRPRDRTPSGLWPSDHDGLVARLSFPGR